MIKILLVSGSIRQGSFTEMTLNLANDYLDNRGIRTDILLLKELNLPFCDGSDHYPLFPHVNELKKRFKNTDGIILATPEYHGSLSGVLKNALDLLNGEELENKAVALISILGGNQSTQALWDMRLICRHMHALAIPEQLAIAHANEAFNKLGYFIDFSLQKRLESLLDKLVFYIEATKNLLKKSESNLNHKLSFIIDTDRDLE